MNRNPKKMNKTSNLLLVVALTALFIGVLGYYGASNQPQKDSSTTTNPTATTTTPSVTPVEEQIVYTSAVEKLHFTYPSTWKVISRQAPIPEEGLPIGIHERLVLQSPDQQVTLTWYGGLDGLGGACDDTKSVQNGGCPVLEFLEKVTIPETDFYFASYLLTNDGKYYYPVFALQPTKGGVFENSNNSLVYLTFSGKNKGSFPIGLISGTEVDGSGLTKRTKAQAREFFATPTALEAKKIIMSVRY